MKPSILFIIHMHSPIYGVAMIQKYIHDSLLINETFGCHYINLAMAKDSVNIREM